MVSFSDISFSDDFRTLSYDCGDGCIQFVSARAVAHIFTFVDNFCEVLNLGFNAYSFDKFVEHEMARRGFPGRLMCFSIEFD